MGELRVKVEGLIRKLPDPVGAADGEVITKTSYVDERGLTQDTYMLAPPSGGGGGAFYLSGNAPDGVTGTAYSFTPTATGFAPDDWEALTALGAPPTGVLTDPTTGEQAGNPTVFSTFSWYVSARESASGKTDIIHLRATIANGTPTWDAIVAAYTPLIWLKCNEVSIAAFLADGNFGSGGGTVASSSLAPGGAGGVTFGNPGFMPSDTSRKVITVAAGPDYIDLASVSPGVDMRDCSIYHMYKGTTGNAAIIPWRSVGGSGDFIRYDFTDVQIRIDGTDYTTTYPVASILDGNPHLIGVIIKSPGTTMELWVDGTKVWNGSITASTGTMTHWIYLQNGNNSFQKPYGDFGDFFVINSGLTDPDHVALYNSWI